MTIWNQARAQSRRYRTYRPSASVGPGPESGQLAIAAMRGTTPERELLAFKNGGHFNSDFARAEMRARNAPPPKRCPSCGATVHRPHCAAARLLPAYAPRPQTESPAFLKDDREYYSKHPVSKGELAGLVEQTIRLRNERIEERKQSLGETLLKRSLTEHELNTSYWRRRAEEQERRARLAESQNDAMTFGPPAYSRWSKQ